MAGRNRQGQNLTVLADHSVENHRTFHMLAPGFGWVAWGGIGNAESGLMFLRAQPTAVGIRPKRNSGDRNSHDAMLPPPAGYCSRRRPLGPGMVRTQEFMSSSFCSRSRRVALLR